MWIDTIDLIRPLWAQHRGMAFRFAILLVATNGHIGGNARLPNVVKRAREKGIQVLDLSTQTLKLQARPVAEAISPRGSLLSNNEQLDRRPHRGILG
jgi:hypothetical protein